MAGFIKVFLANIRCKHIIECKCLLCTSYLYLWYSRNYVKADLTYFSTSVCTNGLIRTATRTVSSGICNYSLLLFNFCLTCTDPRALLENVQHLCNVHRISSGDSYCCISARLQKRPASSALAAAAPWKLCACSSIALKAVRFCCRAQPSGRCCCKRRASRSLLLQGQSTQDAFAVAHSLQCAAAASAEHAGRCCSSAHPPGRCCCKRRDCRKILRSRTASRPLLLQAQSLQDSSVVAHSLQGAAAVSAEHAGRFCGRAQLPVRCCWKRRGRQRNDGNNKGKWT